MKELLTKIAMVKQNIGTLSKSASNPFFKSKYLDLNEILTNLEPLLEASKMVLLQPVENGNVATVIYDIESGQSIRSEIKLPEIADPQKVGSAITYYRRYSLQSLLSLQAEDDDGNKASAKTPDAVKRLTSCQSIEELGTVYKSLTKTEQTAHKDLAAGLKAQFLVNH